MVLRGRSATRACKAPSVMSGSAKLGGMINCDLDDTQVHHICVPTTNAS